MTFRYVDHELDPSARRLVCRYELDGEGFTEVLTFPDAPAERFAAPEVRAAARRVHLLAGASYYKTRAPATIEVPDGLTPAERALLTATYREGLAEFAHVNGLDLSGVEVVADERAPAAAGGDAPPPGRPLVPFGGGIDSIVTVELLRATGADLTLFVMSRPGDHFAAIEESAAVAGLPVVRAYRELDPKVLASAEHGYLNGHVPVTGILSAVALVAAALWGHDAVVMSNEHSASAGSTMPDGSVVNHQWSKSLEFEDLLRAALAEGRDRPAVDYFSYLRPFSELLIARRFAEEAEYHPVFRSCNRAFLSNPEARATTWCGTCDKCCFIDLILAPFLGADELAKVFGGAEPLEAAGLDAAFDALVGVGDPKPFECVGDVDECRAAVGLAARRPDRSGTATLDRLAAVAPADLDAVAARLLGPLGRHNVPDAYAPRGLLG